MGSGFDDWVYWHSFPITINYNSSESMTLYDSLHSLLNYECLPFHCDEWRTKNLSGMNSRIHCLLYMLGGPHRKHHVEQLTVICCPVGCPGNPVFSNLLPGNDSFAAIRCNGNVISGTLFSKRTSASGSTIPAFSRHVTIFWHCSLVIFRGSILVNAMHYYCIRIYIFPRYDQ
jgi:hypothetical protein